MAQRTYLHVGTPKSGTTFLQRVLWQNAETLRAEGFLLPGRIVTHYTAARAVTERQPPSSRGDHRAGPTPPTMSPVDDHAWTKLARQVNRWPGAALIGHPALASATPEQAERAVAAIDGDVHLVVTARPVHLQAALAWQEQVKAGRSTSLDAFLERLQTEGNPGQRFWRQHDLTDVLARWRGALPSEHVHLVTVPGSTPQTQADEARDLWARYAGVLGLAPTAYDAQFDVVAHGLGVVESELLRAVHARRDPRFTDPQRHVWTRQLLANGVLARRPGTPLRLPMHARPWLSEKSQRMADSIRGAGYDVAGDLSTLAWPEPPAEARLLTDVTPQELESLASWTILRLQEELVHREPVTSPPPVGPDDGVDGIIELLEHIRAADTGHPPRSAPRDEPRTLRLRQVIPVRRSR